MTAIACRYYVSTNGTYIFVGVVIVVILNRFAIVNVSYSIHYNKKVVVVTA